MKHLLIVLAALLMLASPALAEEPVITITKGSVPKEHISVFCVSGYKFATIVFCGTSGNCALNSQQIIGVNGKPETCKK